MADSIIKKAEEYVVSLLTSKTPSEYVYHDISHTKEVVEACKEMGKASGLSDIELEIVTIAAWFHDLGYIEKVEGHEAVSIKYAQLFLGKSGYAEDKIEKIKNCIIATRMHQNPKNHLEKILCDADLSHIGKITFEDQNNLFRHEFEHLASEQLTEYEWIRKTIDFVKRHHFFTDYAIKNFSKHKQENLRLLKQKLKATVRE